MIDAGDLFESGNACRNTLTDLAAIMGTRDAAICRELTKRHEEIKRRADAEWHAGRYAGDPRRIRAGNSAGAPTRK